MDNERDHQRRSPDAVGEADHDAGDRAAGARTARERNPRERDRDREQLQLIDPARRPWRLDEPTRQRGLQGIAEAREALRKARERSHPTAA